MVVSPVVVSAKVPRRFLGCVRSTLSKIALLLDGGPVCRSKPDWAPNRRRTAGPLAHALAKDVRLGAASSPRASPIYALNDSVEAPRPPIRALLVSHLPDALRSSSTVLSGLVVHLGDQACLAPYCVRLCRSWDGAIVLNLLWASSALCGFG
jgi:hypothetical protein